MKTKPTQKPLPAFANITTSAYHPCAQLLIPTLSHFLDGGSLPHGRHTSASLGVFPKQTRAIQLGFLPPAPTLCLLVYEKLFSWYQQVGRQVVWESKSRKDTQKWTIPSILYTRLSTKMIFWDPQVYCSFTVWWQVQSSHKIKSFNKALVWAYKYLK